MIILQNYNRSVEDCEFKKIINNVFIKNKKIVSSYFIAKNIFPIQKMPSGAKLIYDLSNF